MTPDPMLMLYFSMWGTVTLMFAALLLGIGSPTQGMRAWILALMLQSVGWACLLVPAATLRTSLDALGMIAIVASVTNMLRTVAYFLKSPIAGKWVLVIPAGVTCAFQVAFSDNPLLCGIVVNTLIASQLLLASWMLLRPCLEPDTWRWRWLGGSVFLLTGLGVCFNVMASAVGWTGPAQPSPLLSSLVPTLTNAWLTVGTLAVLLAHRHEAERALREQALVDGLTGVLNRRGLLERATTLLQAAARYNQPLVAMMVDLDHFKQVNDVHGHPVGDKVLQHCAHALRDSVRQHDLVGRYGGEEFCVFLAHANLDALTAIDGRVRAALSERLKAALGFDVTFSAGAASFCGSRDGYDDLIASADKALYEAKHGGRARLVIAVNP